MWNGIGTDVQRNWNGPPLEYVACPRLVPRNALVYTIGRGPIVSSSFPQGSGKETLFASAGPVWSVASWLAVLRPPTPWPRPQLQSPPNTPVYAKSAAAGQCEELQGEGDRVPRLSKSCSPSGCLTLLRASGQCQPE